MPLAGDEFQSVIENLSFLAWPHPRETRLTVVIFKGCYLRPLGTQKGPWAEFGGKSSAEAPRIEQLIGFANTIPVCFMEL